MTSSLPYDPESPPFDRRHGPPAWAIRHDSRRTAAACADDLADYEHTPDAPLPPPPTRSRATLKTKPPLKRRKRVPEVAPEVAPNADLVDDGSDHMYGFDLCATKGGMRFLINSLNPHQALCVEHGPLTSVPPSMLRSAVRLSCTEFVFASHAATGERLFEEV